MRELHTVTAAASRPVRGPAGQTLDSPSSPAAARSDPPLPGSTVDRVDRVVRGLHSAAGVAAATIRICLRYRVTGLAAEAGFFALLSLPPLVLGMVASVGFAGERAQADAVAALQARLEQAASTVLSQDAVRAVIAPTFAEVVRGGRLEIVSIGFLLSLWSGSRALNVYVDTVSIMYGLGGHRGIVRTRLLSFTLYVLSLALGVVVFPLVLLGPGVLSAFLAERLAGVAVPGWLPPVSSLGWCYLPVVVLASVAGLTTLYHVATPVRGRWRRDCPGAVLALLIWLGATVALHGVIAAAVGGTSIYGPLAAPIVIMIWLYLLAIAVLVGAALNATLAQPGVGGRPTGESQPLVRHESLPDRRVGGVSVAGDEPAADGRVGDSGARDGGAGDGGAGDGGARHGGAALAVGGGRTGGGNGVRRGLG